MVENILNINLNDANSSVIAEVLGNKTCKKILSLIAEQEGKEGLSETDVARKLKLAANTVNYNIKKLISAGLIEPTKSFFWSVKGKKIKMYKLANKKIIISTKNSFNSILVTSFFAGVLGFVVKVASNSHLMNSTARQNIVMEKAADLAYSTVSTFTENSNNLLQTTSIFQGTLPWFIYGIILGVVIYSAYNKLKGGLK